MTVVQQQKMIKADADANNNKYWYISIRDDNTVITEYGRVGNMPQSTTKIFGGQYAAERFYARKIREKENKGYIVLHLAEGVIEQQSTHSLEKVALDQIRSFSSETSILIKKLTKENVHNILAATSLKFESVTGQFSTPLGLVTVETINDARKVLSKISHCIVKESFLKFYTTLFNNYLMLIPQKVGAKVDKMALTTHDAVQKQNDILDALEVSLGQAVVPSSIKTDAPVLFSCEIDLVTDNKVIDMIVRKYNRAKNKSHSASKLKVSRVYSVIIDVMSKAFDDNGKPLGNIQQLWHGTRTQNLLSILRGGLIIPPNRSKHVTGRMFGDGVYFSDQSTKALNYSYGYWSGTRTPNCFMFLADVAMGKSYTPGSGWRSDLPRKGYDSTFAEAHVSGVMNNEMIVYNIYQVNLKFLVEFT